MVSAAKSLETALALVPGHVVLNFRLVEKIGEGRRLPWTTIAPTDVAGLRLVHVVMIEGLR